MEHDAEDVGQGQGHHKIRNESHQHHRLDIGQATHGIAISTLEAIRKLIDDERKNGRADLGRDFR